MKTLSISIAAAMFAAAVLAADAVEGEASSFRYGGDIRLRQELWDDIPIPTEEPVVTRDGYCNTYRLRSRIFAAYDFTDWMTANVRFTHMFYDTVAGPESFKWPDEISLDNANLAFRDLTGEGSKLVIGRQDILLGSGRLVFEGTALDAARTTFFDGAFLHQPVYKESSIDLFAVYNKDEDEFAIGHVHRQLRGYSPAVDGRDEAGAGIFVNYCLPDDALIVSLYYIWKHESGAWAADASHIDNADIHTYGFLAKGRFLDRFSAEFEHATQRAKGMDWGNYWSFSPCLLYAGLDWDAIEKQADSKAPFTIGFDTTFLSGDDPDTTRDEAFNPIFSRYPFLSELMIYCFDTEGAGNWNNIIHPRAKASVRNGGHEVLLAAGPVYAEERNGAGGGRDRGWLYTAQYSFPLFSGFENGRGKTTGCLLAEVLDPGDYYLSDRTAYFFRWQVNIAF